VQKTQCINAGNNKGFEALLARKTLLEPEAPPYPLDVVVFLTCPVPLYDKATIVLKSVKLLCRVSTGTTVPCSLRRSWFGQRKIISKIKKKVCKNL